MRILILTLVFPPDSVSTSQIMGDLACDLQDRGHDMVILTTTPHYNRDPEAEAKQPLRSAFGRVVQKSDFHGMPVFHLAMPSKKSSVSMRLLSWIWFHAICTVIGGLFLPRADVILAPSPPLTIGINAWLIGLLKKRPYVYNVQEIYPDYAVDMGAIKNKLLIKILLKIESFIYRKAAKVTVIAPYMAQKLLKKGVSSKKIQIIPNFVDVDFFAPKPKDNAFSRKHNLHNKFVVSYAGNMGPGQDLENFIQTARILKTRSDIQFVMMGDGMLRSRLEQSVQGLPNFTFLPYQPYSLVPQIYSASDLNLVPQDPKIARSAVPSKVYRIMACGRPVLATTVPESDLATLVHEARCGIVVNPQAPDLLAEAIKQSVSTPERLQKMGEAGRRYVVANFSRQFVSAQYENLLKTVVQNKDSSNHYLKG